MEQIKSLALPAALAYAGVALGGRAASALGLTSTLPMILAGVAGAGLGIWVSRKV